MVPRVMMIFSFSLSHHTPCNPADIQNCHMSTLAFLEEIGFASALHWPLPLWLDNLPVDTSIPSVDHKHMDIVHRRRTHNRIVARRESKAKDNTNSVGGVFVTLCYDL